MNVIKIRNELKNKAQRIFPQYPMFETHKWINCEIAKISMESFINTELGPHLTRTDEPKYTKINYTTDFCEACGKCE